MLEGVLPAALRGAEQVAVYAEVVAPGNPEQIVERLSPYVFAYQESAVLRFTSRP